MKKGEEEPTLDTLFILGIGLVGVGAAFAARNIAITIAFFSIGIAFIIIGAMRSKKW